jgi:hypothetical protein
MMQMKYKIKKERYMKCRKIAAFVAVLLLTGFITAAAEEKFGLEVYHGAKYDASTSKTVSESMSINASCYRTNDDIAKVIEFYRKQAGLEFMGGSQEGAMFKKGNMDITIQNPWMNMQSGMMMKDTLITIVKHQDMD